MTHEQAHATPFDDLDPSLWRTTKTAHITFTIIGAVLLLPAAGIFFALWQLTSSPFLLADDEVVLILGSAMIGAVSGCFAWCALCLLFFKKSDARWQRIAWSACATFGYLTIPCVIGWIIWMLGENPPAVGILILLGILGTAICCAQFGTRYARLAKRSIKGARSLPAGTINFNDMTTVSQPSPGP